MDQIIRSGPVAHHAVRGDGIGLPVNLFADCFYQVALYQLGAQSGYEDKTRQGKCHVCYNKLQI